MELSDLKIFARSSLIGGEISNQRRVDDLIGRKGLSFGRYLIRVWRAARKELRGESIRGCRLEGQGVGPKTQESWQLVSACESGMVALLFLHQNSNGGSCEMLQYSFVELKLGDWHIFGISG